MALVGAIAGNAPQTILRKFGRLGDSLATSSSRKTCNSALQAAFFPTSAGPTTSAEASVAGSHQLGATVREPVGWGLAEAFTPALANKDVMASADNAEPGDSDGWDDSSGWSLGQASADELDLETLTGRTLADRYLIGPLLGTGGFSWVFRAKQLSTGQDVAVKVPRAAGEPAARLKRGGRLLGKLDHPCIANLIDSGEFTIGAVRLPFVVMQLVHDARLLGTYCKEEDLDRRSRLELFAKICDAVHSAHMIEVVHRDLKPGNILVNRRGEPKVIDFDIARLPAGLLTTALAPEASTQGVVGTPRYMAPEQLHEGPVSAASDVFTLGVILHEIMTGEALKQPAAFGLSEGNSSTRLPSGVNQIIRRCTADEPLKRYQDAGALAVAVRDCLKSRGYSDPWWLTTRRSIAHAFRQSAARIQVTARSRNIRRLAVVSFLLAVFFWTAVGRPPEKPGQKEAGYRTAIAAAIAIFADDVSDPTIRRERVQAAAASWRAWQSDELPLEIVCMQNLLADAAPPRLSDVRVAALSPSGRWLATATTEGPVKLAKALDPTIPVTRLPGLAQADQVIMLTMDPRNRLAAGTVGGDWRVWDLDDLGRSSRPVARNPISGDGGIAALDFSADGRLLAVISATGGIGVWSVGAEGEPECIAAVLSGESPPASPRSACFNGDGTQLFVATDGGRLRVVTVSTGADVTTYEGLGAGPPTLARSADGSRLVSFVPGGSLRWHDPNTGRPLPETALDPTGCRCAAFTHDGSRLLVVRQRMAEETADHVVDVFAAGSTGDLQRMDRLVSLATSQSINAVAVGNGSRVAAEVAGTWQLWAPDPPQDGERRPLAAMRRPLTAAAVTPAID